jgi:hypothetical protein
LASKIPDISKSLLEKTAAEADRAREFYGLTTKASYVIPEWVKSNGKWWSQGKITDQDFTSGLQYLIKEKIIKVSEAVRSDGTAESSIPSWIKKSVGWWANGQTDQNDFVRSME